MKAYPVKLMPRDGSTPNTPLLLCSDGESHSNYSWNIKTSRPAPEHSLTLCGPRVAELPNPILAHE